MKKTAVFKDTIFLDHIPHLNHVECPARLEAIYEGIESCSFRDALIYPSFKPASREILELVHTPAHVYRVASSTGKSLTVFDPDTQGSEHSYSAACSAAGAVVKGVEMLMAGEIDNGFALVRPPGHHAEADRAMGFCLFNNVAIGAKYATAGLGVDRVMIIDWDLHHGNGTQHSFYSNDNVFYFSTHQYPHYPGTGALPEVGSGKGEGFTLNVPLPGSQDDSCYARIFEEILCPVIRSYKPQLIIVSAGFDIYMADPLGGMSVTAEGFGCLARIINEVAAEVCDGKVLFALEGGYNLTGLRDGVLAVLGEISGEKRISDEYFRKLEGMCPELSVLERARSIAKEYGLV